LRSAGIIPYPTTDLSILAPFLADLSLFTRPCAFPPAACPAPALGEALLAQIGLLPDAAVGADRVGLGLRGQAAEEDYALLIAVIF